MKPPLCDVHTDVPMIQERRKFVLNLRDFWLREVWVCHTPGCDRFFDAELGYRSALQPSIDTETATCPVHRRYLVLNDQSLTQKCQIDRCDFVLPYGITDANIRERIVNLLVDIDPPLGEKLHEAAYRIRGKLEILPAAIKTYISALEEAGVIRFEELPCGKSVDGLKSVPPVGVWRKM